MENALSIDLEDWFCVHNMSHIINREAWSQCELRVYESTKRILNLLDKYHVKATFFVLGWIAERLTNLICEIEASGHEIAAHGYHHLLLTEISKDVFEDDLRKTLEVLKKCGIKQAIKGFRAPSFTMTDKTKWALQILEKYNFQYDSSIFPIDFHPDYGMKDAPLHPYKITEKLYEFPLSCIEFFKMRFPCSGGGYFRLLPYQYTKQCIKKCNAQGRPIVFYLHPWEFDPEQPRIALPWVKKFRHYYGLKNTEDKFEKLINDFQFTSIRNVLKI